MKFSLLWEIKYPSKLNKWEIMSKMQLSIVSQWVPSEKKKIKHKYKKIKLPFLYHWIK
jgi:hypothetical protein